MINYTTEKHFEDDITASFLSPPGGYTHNNDVYVPDLGLFPDTLVRFVQRTQPKEWKRFELQNSGDITRKFCLIFNSACDTYGLLEVLRHGLSIGASLLGYAILSQNPV